MKLATLITALFFMSTFSIARADDPAPGKQVAQTLKVHETKEASSPEVTAPYYLFLPKNYKPASDDAKAEKFPMLLFLHGLGESGNGGDDLQKVKYHGPPGQCENAKDFPFVLVSPQCVPPKDYKIGWKVDQLIQLVDHCVETLNVDPDRVYISGLSMGGYGTWRLACEYPDRFAAIAPICGGGDPTKGAALKTMPIWCFHGAKDNIVRISESENMIKAVKEAGGDVKFTNFPEGDHFVWIAAYQNPELIPWLLSHKRGEAKK